MSRKTPIVLRRGPLSGRIWALYRYTRKHSTAGREILQVVGDNREDVTADFDALVCEHLLNDAPDIIGILDGVAEGMECDKGERAQVRSFREALKEIVERHNNGPHVKGFLKGAL